MLSGSIVYGYDYVGPDFSDLCLRRMDGDQGPWELALYVLAMALAGAAWLTLVLGMRGQPRTKAVAAFPVWPRLHSPEPCRSPKLQPIQTTFSLGCWC
jgi:hypothetical protein